MLFEFCYFLTKIKNSIRQKVAAAEFCSLKVMVQSYSVSIENSFHNPIGVESRFSSLTSREREILFELIKSGNIKVVAKNLDISRFTVNQHLRSIYTKLTVKTKLEAVMSFMSYVHCQTKKSCHTPKDIRCKVRADDCDVMLCFLSSFWMKQEFCLLSDGRSQCDPCNLADDGDEEYTFSHSQKANYAYSKDV